MKSVIVYETSAVQTVKIGLEMEGEGWWSLLLSFVPTT